MKRLGKPAAEWTDPKTGLRCIQTEATGDEIMIPVEQLALMICQFDPASIDDPVRREAVIKFQREAALLQPAAAHRRAIKMLRSFGAHVVAEVERLPLKKLEGGK